MDIVLEHCPPQDESYAFWLQDDRYIARKLLTDATIFYFAMRYLCVTPRLFEQVKSLSSDCICVYCVDDIEENARVASLRAAFEKPHHQNTATVFFWAFRDYVEGRRLNARLLRYPGLPAPALGTPADRWGRAILPALTALPKLSRKLVLNIGYSYFRAYAGDKPLPEAPEWIAELLLPAGAGTDDAAAPALEPHIPPV